MKNNEPQITVLKKKSKKASLPELPKLAEEPAHAFLGPSAAKIWYNCNGSVVLSKDMPPLPPSAHAQEGTKAHNYAEKALRAFVEEIGAITIDQALEVAGVDNSEDEEMYRHVKNYVSFCVQVRGNFVSKHPNALTFIEHKVRFSENIWGSADFCVIGANPETNETSVVIIDLKYGRGEDIKVSGSLQLPTYAACAYMQSKKKVSKAFMYIYQPRTPGKEYCRWVLNKDEIENWCAELLKTEESILAMMEGKKEVTLNAGDLSHCRYCRAKVKCPEFKKAISRDAALVLEKDNYPKIINTPLNTLVEIFKRKKAIEHFLNDVEGYLTYTLEKGFDVPGYKLVAGRRQRRWIKGEEERIAQELGALGVSEPWRQDLITIGQVEKELGKDASEKISGMVSLTPLKMQIVPEDDKRPGIDVASEVAGLLTDITD